MIVASVNLNHENFDDRPCRKIGSHERNETNWRQQNGHCTPYKRVDRKWNGTFLTVTVDDCNYVLDKHWFINFEVAIRSRTAECLSGSIRLTSCDFLLLWLSLFTITAIAYPDNWWEWVQINKLVDMGFNGAATSSEKHNRVQYPHVALFLCTATYSASWQESNFFFFTRGPHTE